MQKRPSMKVPIIKTLTKITSAPVQNTSHEDLNVVQCRMALVQRAFFVCAPKILELFKQVNQSKDFATGFQESCYEGSIFLTLSSIYIFYFYIALYSFLYCL